MAKINKNEIAQKQTKRALNHLLKDGFDDIYKKPIFIGHFEIDSLRKNKSLSDELLNNAKKLVLKQTVKDMSISPIDVLLYPKERFSYRKYSYIEPIDNIKYLSLVLHIAESIEEKRVSRNRQIVHSYRFNKTGENIFSDLYNYSSFREKSRELTHKNIGNFKIITDISDFYDRVNLHRIESTLFGCGCDPEIISKINSLLLIWSNKDSYGLPVGCDASRILAEAALIDVDNFLLSHKVKFIRFVDDYRIFVKNREEANYTLSLLTQRLYREGLNLNSHKTKIVECKENAAEEDAREKLDTDEDDTLNELASTQKNSKSKPENYSEKIRLRFQKPSNQEIERLEKIDLKALKDSIDESDDFEVLRDYARAAVLQNSEEHLLYLIELSKSYNFMISYVVDLFIKLNNHIKNETKIKISEEFSDWLNSNSQKPDFVQICLNRLLSHTSYLNSNAIIKFIRSSPKSVSSLVNREAILQIGSKLTRGEMLEIRDFFFKSSETEKRAIAKSFIENNSVHQDEKRPWLSLVQTYTSDPILKNMVDLALKNN